MPKVSIEGFTLAYEVLGKGTPIVLTPQGWFPRNIFYYLTAGRLSTYHQVLLWDRPNCGASSIVIEDTPSELHLWTDALHHLLNALDMSPAYLAGGSNGSVLSLLMAHRYPEDVKGLLLIDPPTDDPTLIKSLADARYFELAEVAESKGMEAVVTHSTEALMRMTSPASKRDWDFVLGGIAECIQLNPSNHARILSMDSERFSAAMKKWGQWYFSERLHLARLSEEELASIAAPALVFYGFNALHPEHTARELSRLLPNAELVQYSARYTQDEIRRVQESDSYNSQNAFLKLPFIEAFLQRHEVE